MTGPLRVVGSDQRRQAEGSDRRWIAPVVGVAHLESARRVEHLEHEPGECRKIIRAARKRLQWLAFAMCSDWHLSEDFVQDAFLKLTKAGRRVCEVENHYMRITLMCVVYDSWRRENPLRLAGKCVNEGVGLEVVLECKTPSWLEPLSDATEKAIEELPERQQQVVRGLILESKNVSEVCQEMGIASGTLYNYKALALKALAEALK